MDDVKLGLFDVVDTVWYRFWTLVCILEIIVSEGVDVADFAIDPADRHGVVDHKIQVVHLHTDTERERDTERHTQTQTDTHTHVHIHIYTFSTDTLGGATDAPY